MVVKKTVARIDVAMTLFCAQKLLFEQKVKTLQGLKIARQVVMITWRCLEGIVDKTLSIGPSSKLLINNY